MLEQDYQQSFIDFKPELQSFVFRLLANRQDTEDVVQDTYIKMQENLGSFKGKSSFKTWVFTIALNLAKNHLTRQKRWLESSQDYGARLHMNSPAHWDALVKVFESTPDKDYEIREHINYCFNCVNKTLELNQQICLLLKEIYGFKVSEIMQMTKLTEGVVKHALADARKNMVRIFDNRCSFVNKNGVCHQCTTLTGMLNKKQDEQIKALEIKMVKEGNKPDKEYLLNLRMDLVRQIDPLNADNNLLTTYMLENKEKWVEEGKEKKLV